MGCRVRPQHLYSFIRTASHCRRETVHIGVKFLPYDASRPTGSDGPSAHCSILFTGIAASRQTGNFALAQVMEVSSDLPHPPLQLPLGHLGEQVSHRDPVSEQVQAQSLPPQWERLLKALAIMLLHGMGSRPGYRFLHVHMLTLLMRRIPQKMKRSSVS